MRDLEISFFVCDSYYYLEIASKKYEKVINLVL